MLEKRMINVFTNNNAVSQETGRVLIQKLEKSGYNVPKEFHPKSELIMCVGGDGGFLRTLHKYDFPDTPFVGINTGHLGFFQDLSPEQIDEFIFRYGKGDYQLQHLKTVETVIRMRKETVTLTGLNEILIKGDKSRLIHLNISIGDSFVERFSGDGILIATPAGSTAHNYALGGCIVDPRIDLLQITPVSPMNTTAYRSFTSSVVIPPQVDIKIYPEAAGDDLITVVVDGMEYKFEQINDLSCHFSKGKEVKFLRLDQYDFWNKVKSKFL